MNMEEPRKIMENIELRHKREENIGIGTQHEFHAVEIGKYRETNLGRIVFTRLITGAHRINELKVLPQELPATPLEIRRMEKLRKELLKFVEKRVLGTTEALKKERKRYSKAILLDAPEEEHEFWIKQGFTPERKPYKEADEPPLLLKKL